MFSIVCFGYRWKMRHLQRCTTSRRNVRYSTHAFVDESICESGFSSFFCALSACNSLAYTSDKIDSMSMDRRPSTLCRADAATFFFPFRSGWQKGKAKHVSSWVSRFGAAQMHTVCWNQDKTRLFKPLPPTFSFPILDGDKTKSK